MSAYFKYQPVHQDTKSINECFLYHPKRETQKTVYKFYHIFIYTPYSTRLRIRNINPAPFNIMSALSFHKILTTNHRDTPMVDPIKSYKTQPSLPLTDIALRMNTLATHLIYQSTVYLGVADFNIRFEFLSSLGSNLFAVIIPPQPRTNIIKYLFTHHFPISLILFLPIT